MKLNALLELFERKGLVRRVRLAIGQAQANQHRIVMQGVLQQADDGDAESFAGQGRRLTEDFR